MGFGACNVSVHTASCAAAACRVGPPRRQQQALEVACLILEKSYNTMCNVMLAYMFTVHIC